MFVFNVLVEARVRGMHLQCCAFLNQFSYALALECLRLTKNVYMHFNGTFEINKYQNKGLYGYGMFLVFFLFKSMPELNGIEVQEFPEICAEQV